MKIVPVSEAKMKLSEILSELATTHEDVVITRNGKPAGVIVQPDEFESWRETLAIAEDEELIREIRRGLEALEHGRAHDYSLGDLFEE